MRPCSDLSTTTPRHHPSQPLPQPIPQLILPILRQRIHTLLTQINPLQLHDILCRRTTNALCDDQRVRLEDDTVVDDLIDREGDEVVVFDYGALVDGLSFVCCQQGWR
jgi:hypothetical protein